MIRKTVFISCGQFTEAEKRLGKRIAEMVRTQTDLEPFFAEDVQDLNGLDSNILTALRNCAAFIVVMHPRGEIKRPSSSVVVRASVWIEQEIAIATYIQRIEKRAIPIHLNPIEFEVEDEVSTQLQPLLRQWTSMKPSGIEIELISRRIGREQGHTIRRLEIGLSNKTNKRIDNYEFEVRIPSSILSHWSSAYPSEVQINESVGLRCFRFNQSGRGAVRPQDRMPNAITFEYCLECAADQHGGGVLSAALVAEAKIGARIWIDGEEYVVEKTIKQLSLEASERGDS